MTIRIVCTGTSLVHAGFDLGGWMYGALPLLGFVSRLQVYVPSRPIEVVNRAIGGAASDRILRNVNKLIECDPSILLIQTDTNDCHIAKGISEFDAEANIKAIGDMVRATLPGCKILLMTLAPVLSPGTAKLIDHPRYLERHRCIGWTYADYFFDGEPVWLRLVDAQYDRRAAWIDPDGIHPTQQGMLKFIVPFMARNLGPRIARDLNSIRSPITPIPTDIWSPLP